MTATDSPSTAATWKGRPIEFDLWTYLENVGNMIGKARRRSGDRFACYEAVTLALGQPWEPAPLRGIWPGQMKQCYHNTLTLIEAAPDQFRYVEGYAIPHIDGENFIPVPHAWAVDPEGRVWDRTWPEPEESAYFGIAFDWADVVRFNNLGPDYLGILGQEYLLGFPLLRTGRLFPEIEDTTWPRRSASGAVLYGPCIGCVAQGGPGDGTHGGGRCCGGDLDYRVVHRCHAPGTCRGTTRARVNGHV